MENVTDLDIAKDPEFQALVRFEMEMMVDEMKRTALRRGFVASGEMINSLQFEGMTLLENTLLAKIKLLGYQRFLDLTKVSYGRTPPFSSIHEWIRNKGLNSFAFADSDRIGWKETHKISRAWTQDEAWNAQRRIAWAITKYRKSTPDDRRGYRGIYGRVTGSGIYKLMIEIVDYHNRVRLSQLKGIIEYKG